MPSTLRNALALVAGIAVGSGVNMGLITLSPSLVVPPPGVDVTDAASLAVSMHLFEPRHYLVPFLAHALGTLAGAMAGYLLSVTHRVAIAYAIGAIFLLGGVAASFMIPAPAWFIVVDLVGAYMPMAWIAQMIGHRIQASAMPNPS